MNTVLDYLAAHQLLWQLGALPLVTALVTWLFKPRSPEQYAALPPRVAAFLKLVAAIGWDAPKILEAIGQLVSGRARSAAAERAAKGLVIALAIGAISASSSACQSSSAVIPQTPRAKARAVVEVLADAVHEADATCASAARAKLDADLADTCAHAYDRARGVLLVAAGGIDAWGTASQGSLACDIVAGAGAAQDLLGALQANGVEVPAALADGLELFAALGLSCPVDAGKDGSQ